MQITRMILFFTLLASTPTLAQTATLVHKLDSDTLIVSQDDEVSIRVHRLPNSVMQEKTTLDEKFTNSKMIIAIHKISEN